ncbi:hypothetical protein EFM32_00150 [Lactiplantibacillus plantarum]|uniref:hypothetical protein n=1 Tax=Lactiplantibacillus plantarum TaxID=1590 RepID=UPI0009755FC9|nr:hypothetical protein [Lactiplantibacillus plantarum]MCT0220037.1 hypothetical protein [Lactiplantibacillus plantarum]
MIQTSGIIPEKINKGFGDPHPQYNQYASYQTRLGQTPISWIELMSFKIDNSDGYTDSSGKTLPQIKDRNRELNYIGFVANVSQGAYGSNKEFAQFAFTINIDDKQNLVVDIDQHPLHTSNHSTSAISPYEFRVYFKALSTKSSDDNKTATQYEVHIVGKMPGNTAPLYLYPQMYEYLAWESPFTPLGNKNYSEKEQLDYLFRNIGVNPLMSDADLSSTYSGFNCVSSADVNHDEHVQFSSGTSDIQLDQNVVTVAMSDANAILNSIIPYSASSNGYTGFELKLLYIGSTATIKSGGTFSYSVPANHIFTGNQDITMHNGRVYKLLRYGNAWFLECTND